MCPIDFGVKRSTVKVMAHGYLKMVHRNNGCRFEFVGVGGGPVLLQQYFQYAFICCPYMLPLLFFMTFIQEQENKQRERTASKVSRKTDEESEGVDPGQEEIQENGGGSREESPQVGY